MGTIKTTNIEPIANNGTVTLGSSGDTFTVPSGVTVNMSSATQTGVGGANTPAFEAYLSSSQTITHDTVTKVAFNTEVFDTASAYDNSSNYRFTPQTAGKYFTYGNVTAVADIQQLKRFSLYIYKNGSTHKVVSFYFNNNEARYADLFIGTVIDMNGSSDYLEMFVKIEYASSGTLQVNGTQGRSGFGAYKIIT
jgi:hypothetical protein